MNVKELSEQLGGENPRRVRRFLRETTPKRERPGRGHRWELDPKQFAQLRQQFEEWTE